MAVILLLDDNPDLLLMVVDMLEVDHHEVRVGVNGKDGLQKLEQASILPDVIFTDIKMPEMNGWDFIASVKRNPRWAHIPCVVFSGDEYDHEVALDRGADAALIKPLRYKQVHQLIQRYARFDPLTRATPVTERVDRYPADSPKLPDFKAAQPPVPPPELDQDQR